MTPERNPAPLSSEEMAAVVVAVTMLVRPRAAPSVVADVTPPWRFSGRSFGTPRGLA
ncbi:MAG: hypothetical protein KGI65_01960 [Acidobacteriota bacterium]|nr:hypothetical protein [Acidobacteriota bacterium]MDE3093688.1 hypothetical protein [Acidobacteriota bacterium]MDE3139649.1 hypothetical protein [Acidobacteriota bacterium]